MGQLQTYILLLLPLWVVGLTNNTDNHRAEKALSVFTVVKFPNTACASGTSGRNGSCYTASECAAKGGSSSGSCASSFGVCCVFEKSCGGGSISENCTYFTSSALNKGGSCGLTICKSDADVCQLRLDFETFVLNNPVTSTAITITTTLNANRIGSCDTDSFGVTVPGGKSPPQICGTNTGQHMYIPASDQCNVLNANIGSSSTATTSAFTIKVTQIECSSKTKAPNGCLQYFTEDTGTIETFNYNSAAGVLLVNQDYSSCVRTGRTYCAICYYSSSFKLSVPNAIAAIGSFGVDTNCGTASTTAYANAGGYDHVVIPGGQCAPATGGATNLLNDKYCGTQLNCLTAVPAVTTAATAGTVCSNQRPFKISVKSDDREYHNPTALSEAVTGRNVGFSLSYYMQTTCLTRPNG